jgi:hypothetical protein
MAINSKLGTIWIKDPATGNWKPVQNMWIKNASGWQPVQKAWTKVGIEEWEQIYPTPSGSLNTNISSLSFTVYQNHDSDTQTVSITNNGTANLSITNIVASNSSYYTSVFSAGATFPITVNVGQSISITIKVRGVLLGKDTSGLLVITATVGTLGTSTLTIPISTTVIPEFKTLSLAQSSIKTTSASTLTMYYGDSLPSTSIPLYNNGNGATVNILSVSSLNGTINVTSYPASIGSPAGNGTLVLSATSKAIGTYVDTITITSDDPVNSTITVYPVTLQVNKKQPIIRVQNTLSDTYNDIAASGNLKSVTIYNDGIGVLNISNLSSTGKCIITNKPTSIPAGSNATFNVTGIQLAASATDTITISCDDPASTTKTIAVEYTIIKQPVISVPASVTDSYNDIDNTGADKTVTITNNGAGELRITSITTASGGAKAKVSISPVPSTTAPLIIAAGASANFKVTGQKLTNSDTDTITITSNDPINSSKTIPVTYTITQQPIIAVTPSPVTDTYKDTDTTGHTVTVTITNGGAGTLNISSISTTSGGSVAAVSGLATPTTVAAGASKTFNIIGQKLSKTTNDTINIISNDRGILDQLTVVPVTLTISAVPVISVPASVTDSYNDIDNTGATKTVTITNTGTSPLSITSITTVSGGSIARVSVSPVPIASSPLSIAPGASVNFSVTGQKITGTATDTIGITNNTNGVPGTLTTIPVTYTITNLPVIEISPTSLTDSYYDDTAGTVKTLTIYNRGPVASLTITNPITISDNLTIVTAPGSYTIAGGGSNFITLTVKGNQLAGAVTQPFVQTYNEKISVYSNNRGNAGSLSEIPFLLNVTKKIAVIGVSPTTLTDSYYDTDAGGTGKLITIKNTGLLDLTVNSIVSRNSKSTISGISLPVTVTKNGGTATFTVTGKKITTGGTILDFIDITNTGDLSNPIVTVNLQYNITVKQAAIQVYPAIATPTAGTVVTPISSWTLNADTNKPNSQTIVIKNISPAVAGSRSITISDISPSGSCTVSALSTTVIAPQQTATAIVSAGDDWPTTGQQQIGTLTINSDTTTTGYTSLAVPVLYTYIPKYPNILVYLGGTTTSLSTISLGTIKQGDTPTSVKVWIQNTQAGSSPLSVTAINSTNGYTSYSDITPTVTINPGTSLSFNLTFSAWNALATGTYTDTMTIVSNDPDTPNKQITITGTVIAKQPSLNANKSSLSLTNVAGTDLPTTTIVLKNNGDNPSTLNISSISSSLGNFTVSQSSASLNYNESITLTLTMVSTTDVGSYNDSLIIKSNAANGETQNIPVSIKVTQPAFSAEYTAGTHIITHPGYSVRNLTITLVGGGGGGGSGTEGGNGGGGGGGGSGAAIVNWVYPTTVSKDHAISITVGAAGLAIDLVGDRDHAGRNARAGAGGVSSLSIANIIVASVNGGTGGVGADTDRGGAQGAGGTIVKGGITTDTNINKAGKSGTAGIKGTRDDSSSNGGAGGTGTLLDNKYYGTGGNGADAPDRTAPYDFQGSNGQGGYVKISWPAYTPP